MYEIKSRRLRSQILTCFIFLVLLWKNHGFTEKNNPSEKSGIVDEELVYINLSDIGNLKNLLRLVFINEKGGNLIVVNDGWELTRNINQKKKLDVLLQMSNYWQML